MLYKLQKNEHNIFDSIEPMPFLDFGELGHLEKDLENLMARHLFDMLFEDANLLPVFQERPMQAEADIYAVTREGDLVIFELKRGIAGADAVLQALRYTQDAGQWSYSKLDAQYKNYKKSTVEMSSLAEAHKEAFGLEKSLEPAEFNRKQRCIIVGSVTNQALIDAVDYWKKQGLWMDFLPYRIYEMKAEYYFEFFALPHDQHRNPKNIKAVMFDTCRSHDENAIWDMMEKKRIAAYGEIRYVVGNLQPKDVVFYSHTRVGIVAAAEVISPVRKDEKNEEWYCDVRFLTTPPKRGIDLKAMPFREVTALLNKTFFWARTIKVPYLSSEEGKKLLEALRKYTE